MPHPCGIRPANLLANGLPFQQLSCCLKAKKTRIKDPY